MLRGLLLSLFLISNYCILYGGIKGSDYSFRHITIENGLSHADANALVQDDKGYIWIGTYSGLDRYDGFRVKSFYNETDFLNRPYINRIADIHIGKGNMLWLATNGGVQLFDCCQERFLPIVIKNQSLRQEEHDLKKITVVDDTLFTIDKYQHINQYQISIVDGRYTLTKKAFALNVSCSSFFKDMAGRLWISTGNGVWNLDKSGKLVSYKLPELANKVSLFYFDQDVLFVCNEDKVLFYSSGMSDKLNLPNVFENGTEIYLGTDCGKVTDIRRTSTGEYWISTLKGLFSLTKCGADFSVQTFHTDNSQYGLSSDFINQLLIDRSQNLFVATYAGGVNILNLNRKPFYSISFTPDSRNIIPEKIVRSVVSNGKLICIGSNAMGITIYNRQTKEHNSCVYPKLKSNEIRSMLLDKHGLLWVGHVKGLDVMTVGEKKKKLSLSVHEAPRFPNLEVSCIAEDYYGQIWVGTWYNGICKIKNKNGIYHAEFLKTSKSEFEAFNSSRIITIYASQHKPELFFSSGERLVRVFLNKNGDIENTLIYENNKDKKNSLSSNFICSIRQKNDSILWLGSIGGGLTELTMLKDGDYHAKNYSNAQGLNLKDVECLEQDDKGNLWLGGNELVKFNTKTHLFKSYPAGGNGYKVGASFKGNDGMLYFGGINGLLYFNPDDIIENRIYAHPEISSILINNRHPLIGNEENCALNQGVAYTDKIKLAYNENNISLDLYLSNYINPAGCEFQYRLKGYESQFHTIAGIPSISYASIPPGKYELELYALNDDGLVNPEKRLLKIMIMPPWWFSVWAKVLYVLLVMSILTIVFLYLHKWLNLKKQFQIQGLEEKHKEEIHQMQLQFFTNISHEFRTPLTLIFGVAEQMSKENIGLKKINQLDILLSNVKRLMRLINELMDFRKAETGHFCLSVQERDINAFARGITEEFKELAERKRVLFDVQIRSDVMKVWFDSQIIEKIVINLLNNAFNYTNEGGYVQMSIFTDNNGYITPFENSYSIQNDFEAQSYIYLSIKDNGVGISGGSIEKVFDRFYQIEDSDCVHHLGSGIGLALVKSLIMLHKGRLTIYSERNKGTEFIAAIPISREDYRNDEISNSDLATDESKKYIMEHTPIVKRLVPQKKWSEKKPCILLVEDNNDVRNFICEVLSEEYHIYEAANGVEALGIIKMDKPDIIISDLMMPQMDGLELCRTLKNNQDTDTIPFIMLTAKNTVDDEISGIANGADAYIGKPVSTTLLITTIQNLLLQKDRIRKQVSANYLFNAIDNTLQEKDRLFYEQLIAVIERNLSNTELDVDLISRELNYSRTKLYQRVKSVAGKPIMDLVRSVRLRKAAQYMAEEDISIQVIMEKVGIQSQSNFSSSFKKEYSKTPSQFIADLKKTI